MRLLPVALIAAATAVAGCQSVTMPPVEELSPPQQALAQVIPPRGGVVLAAFTDPQVQPQFLTDDLVTQSQRAATCHQEAYGDAMGMQDILPILTDLPNAVFYESQIETARAAQISVLTGKTPGAERVDVTLLRQAGVWKIADLSHQGKLLSVQLGGHCDYIAREAAAVERAAARSEAEAEADMSGTSPAEAEADESGTNS